MEGKAITAIPLAVQHQPGDQGFGDGYASAIE
jgi:hypothetical protein